MQEVFEKIKERLREHNRKLKSMKNMCIALSDSEVSDIENHAYNTAIEIVNQVAEEYVPDINVGNTDKFGNSEQVINQSLTNSNQSLTNGGWIDAELEVPVNDNYILLSFESFNVPQVGRYVEDEEGGAFYIGDDEISCCSHGLFVNAWQPLPEPYKGE